RLTTAEEPGVADGAAENSAQHVAASFIRREHAVGEQNRHRTGMIRNDAKGCRLGSAWQRLRLTRIRSPRATRFFASLRQPLVSRATLHALITVADGFFGCLDQRREQIRVEIV